MISYGKRRVPTRVVAALVAVVLLVTMAFALTGPDKVKTRAEMPVGISVGNHLIDASDDALDRAMDDFVKLHVPWIRLDIDWRTIQPDDRLNWQFKRMDRIVEAANDRGLKILGIVTYTPEWARESGCDQFTCPPADDRDFARFARRVAERYEGRVNAYEIWNEPNWQGFWRTPDPERYGRLLQRSTRAIKAMDDQAKLILGGLSASEPSQSTIDAADFIRRACVNGVCDRLDAIGFHPYTFPRLATDHGQPATTWQRMLEDYDGPQGLRPAIRESGLGDLPIWVTEYGAPTGGRSTDSYVSEERQADIMYSGLRAAERNSSQVQALFWYTRRDLRGTYGNSEDFFGLRRTDGSPKPAWGVTRSTLSP